MRRVRVVHRVPPHRLDQRRRRERARQDPQPVVGTQARGEPALQQRDAVGAGHEVGDGQERLDDDLRERLDPADPQLLRGRGERRGPVVDRDPRELAQVVEGDLLPHPFVARRDDHHPGVVVEVEVGHVVDEAVRQQEPVDGAQPLGHPGDVLGAVRTEPQPGVRGLPGERGRERRAEDARGVVGDEQRELAGGGRGVEVRGDREHPFDPRDRALRPVDEAHRERGQLVAVADPHEQLVTEVAPQPGQRRADGGLGQAEGRRRPRDVAFGQQRAQREQQVQVEVRQAPREGRGGGPGRDVGAHGGGHRSSLPRRGSPFNPAPRPPTRSPSTPSMTGISGWPFRGAGARRIVVDDAIDAAEDY